MVGAEIRGTADSASLYGLLFARRTPLRVDDEVKVVWRMTGSGDLTATATAPSGQPAKLTFGPEAHGGSTYTRPGDEWGTGYLFSEAGCWHLHFARDHATAEVWLLVLA